MSVMTVSATPVQIALPRIHIAIPSSVRVFVINALATLACVLIRCTAAVTWTYAAAQAGTNGQGLLMLALGVLAYAHLRVPGPGRSWVRLAVASLRSVLARTARTAFA